MAVYVDQSLFKFGRMIMCHMTADTLTELHEMADAIGLRRKWFQDKRIPHYDICKAKRALAIKQGAVSLTTRQLIKQSKLNEHEKDS